MNTIKLLTESRRQLADLQTPVSIYLNLRDKFANTILLESSDYQSKENSFSFIGAEPIAEVLIQDQTLSYHFPEGEATYLDTPPSTNVSNLLQNYCNHFTFEGSEAYQSFNGLFGHTNFDAVQYFEDIVFDPQKRQDNIPDLRYAIYRFVVVINHYKNEMYLLENRLPHQPSKLEELSQYLSKGALTTFDFKQQGPQKSNITDLAFKQLVRKGKAHCARGDVFQIVFARQFQQKFVGDEFNVYRALRSINPSPYLFYFDYGSYKLFGSSPEAQLVIKEKKATLTPIAGTYKRTGNPTIDQQLASTLLQDPKEIAEHTMLVDLARNDLNRHTQDVAVSQFKQIQYYSHVIHLVSKVEGKMPEASNIFQVFGDTFPAGTLSGAPKYKALQLIDRYENQHRGYYGGAIGFFNPTGDINQAIMIRSFMSHHNTLYYQAGAGIVIDSDEEKELQEVNNKLAALHQALQLAETI